MTKLSPTKPRRTRARQAREGLACFAAGEKLATFEAPGVALPAEENVPGRLLIAPWGTRTTETGPVTVNEATAKGLAKNNKHPFDRVVLDFCHNTEKGGPEPKPVAAYGVPEVIPGEGLFLTNLEWTPSGAEAWKNRWYADTSPTVARSKAGEIIFVKSAALCRNGRIPGLENFSNDDNEPEYNMKKSDVIALLNKVGSNLPADATDEQIAAATDKLSGESQGSEPGAVEGMSADLRKQLQTFQAEFAAQLGAMKESLAKEKAEAAKARKLALIEAASRDGKVIPFSNDDILAESFSVEMLEKCIAGLEAGKVPFKAGAAGAKEGTGKADKFSAEDRMIAKILGVKDADLEKYGDLPDQLQALPV